MRLPEVTRGPVQARRARGQANGRHWRVTGPGGRVLLRLPRWRARPGKKTKTTTKKEQG